MPQPLEPNEWTDKPCLFLNKTQPARSKRHRAASNG